MKKIIPFNNVLEFNTDVREITAISLEHEIKKYPDMISGTFYISGEYKITDGQLEREKFNFELPFDIALTTNYELDSLVVDIDDFRYELISDKKLKVNIDLYVDGEEVEVPTEREISSEELNIDLETKDIRDLTEDILTTIPKEEIPEEKLKEETFKEEMEEDSILENSEEQDENKEEVKQDENNEDDDVKAELERVDLLKDMLTIDKENTMDKDISINNENENENVNENSNIFIPNQEEEKYVTYRVYKVLDNDTLDSILTKYNITKEILADYNNIENITPGDKLIIPTDEK